MGINIKPIDLSNKDQLDRYIENIIKIKTDEDTKIYLEGFESIPLNILNYIIKSTELNFASGYNTRILNISNVIEEVHAHLRQSYSSKDTLIICSDVDTLKQTLNVLSDNIKFFTVIGVDKSIKEEIYEEILDSTGISIFQPNNLEKVIRNYGIIINFNDNIEFNINAIRNEALILDFSKTKPFDGISKSKKTITITDVNFDVNLDSNRWIEKRITPALLENLNQQEGKVFSQIKTRNDFYFIKDFLANEIKLKGRI